MNKNNLLHQIAIIAQKENGIMDFTSFLEGSDPSIILLWQFILNCDGRYTDSKEDRMLAFSSIFNKTTVFDASRMRHLIKLLRTRMIRFIFLDRLETTASGQRFCAEVYRSTGNFRKMKEANDKALKMASDEEEKTCHYLKWEINHDRHFYGNNETSGATESLKKSDKELDNFYLVAKLKNIIEELSACRVYDKKIEDEINEKIKIIRQMLPENQIPLIFLQVSAIDYYSKPTIQKFEQFKKHYFCKVNLLHSEKEYLLISLVNALAVLPNLGEKSREEYRLLYKYGLENNLLIENGEISSLRFDNIIFIAEALEDYHLIDLAINKLGLFIENEREKNRSLLMANAFVSFGKKKYDDAMGYLSVLEKCKGLPYYFVLRKHILDFKCAFEKIEDKQEVFLYLKSKENNFRKRINYFVLKGYITNSSKKNYLNFFNLLCKIANKKYSRLIVLKKFSMVNGDIIELKWISEKIAELT